MSANVLRGCDATACHRTFTADHGGAVPGGPFPGTFGSKGDVRRCEHGRVWIFARSEAYRIDIWRPVSRFWEPVIYRRAIRELATTDTEETA